MRLYDSHTPELNKQTKPRMSIEPASRQQPARVTKYAWAMTGMAV